MKDSDTSTTFRAGSCSLGFANDSASVPGGEIEVWGWIMKLKLVVEVWSLSLKFNVLCWSLKLKFEVEVWSLKFEVEV